MWPGRAAALLIAGSGVGRGLAIQVPPPEGAYWPAADGPGAGLAWPEVVTSPPKGRKGRALLTSAVSAFCALGRNAAAGWGRQGADEDLSL